MASLPTAADLRAFLEGYDLDEVVRVTRLGTVSAGSQTIEGVEDAGDVSVGWRVESDLFPQGALVAAVDGPAKTVTVDSAASANRPDASIVYSGFTVVSDPWLTSRRDAFIVPWVEEKTRLSFTGATEYVEYHSGNGGVVLALNRKPIVAVSSLEIVEVETEPEYFIDLGSVEVLYEYGILRARSDLERVVVQPAVFPRGELNIKVTFTAGYASDALPGDVAEAILCLWAEKALGHIAGQTGGGSLNTQGYNRSFGARGKYTEHRNDLARQGISLLRKYMSGTVGA